MSLQIDKIPIDSFLEYNKHILTTLENSDYAITKECLISVVLPRIIDAWGCSLTKVECIESIISELKDYYDKDVSLETWTSRDGTTFDISCFGDNPMSTNHIKNTITYITNMPNTFEIVVGNVADVDAMDFDFLDIKDWKSKMLHRFNKELVIRKVK